MADQLQLRGGTTAEHSTFTGALREVTVDTDKDVLVVHDNATAGGHPLMAEDGSNSALAAGSVGTPSLKFAGDTNTGIFSPAADQLAISTGGVEKVEFAETHVVFNDGGGDIDFRVEGDTEANLLFVDASTDRIGVGTSTPAQQVTIGDGATTGDHLLQVTGDTSNVLIGQLAATQFGLGANTGAFVLGASGDVFGVGTTAAQPLVFGTDSAERARFDSAGRFFLGTTTSRANLYNATGTHNPRFQNEGTSLSTSMISNVTNSNDVYGGYLILGKSRGTTANSYTIVQSGDDLGVIDFQGADGTHLIHAARIGASVDGTPGANDMPARLTFATAADGEDVPTERMRIDSEGRVGIGSSNPAAFGQFVVRGTSHQINIDSSSGKSSLRFLESGSGRFNLDTLNGSVGLAFRNSAAEFARIDSSGRVLIGSSTSRDDFYVDGVYNPQIQNEGTSLSTSMISNVANSNDTYGPYLHLGKSRGTTAGSNTLVQNGDSLGIIDWFGADGSKLCHAASIGAVVDATPGTNDMPTSLIFSTTADSSSSPSQRFKINSSGRYYFNTNNDVNYAQTSDSNNIGSGTQGNLCFRADTGALIVANKADSGFSTVYLNKYNWSSGKDSRWMQFNANGSSVGTIQYTGSAVAYNTTSDYRLKENVVALTDGIDRVKQLNVNRFNFINNPGQTVDGFIAHEVQTVVPEAICGEKDAVDDEGNPVYQGIDQSKLVPLLTAALQEAIAKIETLEAKVAALEAS